MKAACDFAVCVRARVRVCVCACVRVCVCACVQGHACGHIWQTCQRNPVIVPPHDRGWCSVGKILGLLPRCWAPSSERMSPAILCWSLPSRSWSHPLWSVDAGMHPPTTYKHAHARSGCRCPSLCVYSVHICVDMCMHVCVMCMRVCVCVHE